MISIIVAYDEARTIGRDGALPWHFKEDLAYFKKITLHHTCVMGRKTYDSIVASLNKPLPDRENIVVTRQKLSDEGVTFIHDFEHFLDTNQYSDEEIFVIGGKEIYTMALPYAKKLYITHVNGRYEGDTVFPYVDFSKYERIYHDEHAALTFAIYERK